MAAADLGIDYAADDLGIDYAADVLNRVAGTWDYMVKVIRDLNPRIEINADNAAVDPHRDLEVVAGITKASLTRVRFIDKIEEFYLKLVQNLRAPLAEAKKECLEAMAVEKEKDETIARLQKEKDDAIWMLQKEEDEFIWRQMEKEEEDTIQRLQKEEEEETILRLRKEKEEAIRVLKEKDEIIEMLQKDNDGLTRFMYGKCNIPAKRQRFS